MKNRRICDLPLKNHSGWYARPAADSGTPKGGGDTNGC
jgi:hypothetical protein